MTARITFPDLDAMRRSTFCGTPLGEYTHDELLQMVHEAIRFQQGNLNVMVEMAVEFNRRRQNEALMAGCPFISRRAGAGGGI